MSSDLKSNVRQINLKADKPSGSRIYEFDDFQLDAEHLMLYRKTEELRLTPKQVETLLALVERNGEIVSKDALMNRLWGESAVEESNLVQNIYILRKVLGTALNGKPMIETLRRRGYRFNCDLKSRVPSKHTSGSKFHFSGTRAPRTHSENELFVGREQELSKLDERLEGAVNGNGQFVFITGEPGIGKSSLATEFLYRSQKECPGLILATGRCLQQYGPGEAYLPFLDAFGGLLSGPSREVVMATLRTHAPTWCLQFPAEFGPLGVLEELQRETMGATKERMLREMSDTLAALSTRSPVVLLLEDLHWADPSSVDLLRYLCQRLNGKRMLVIGALRPEDLEIGNRPLKNYRREMLAHRLCDEIALRSLEAGSLGHYLDERFPQNDFSRRLADLLERKTEGHPLFVTSLVDLLVERGDISMIKGDWKFTRPLDDLDLETPQGVRSMIRKKVEALDDSARTALKYASVEGSEFLSTVVAELMDVDDLVLEEQLDQVGRVHHLVYSCGEEELPNGALAIRYRFSHVLYQNCLYSDLSTKRRIALHRQAGEIHLKLYGELALRNAAQLAIHFERGRDFSRAIEYLTHAGDNATKVFANHEAEQHFSRALGLIHKLPTEDTTTTSIILYHKRGTVNQVLSRFDNAVSDFTQMLELARRHGLPEKEHAALNAMGTTLFWAHRMGEMSDRIDEVTHVAAVSNNEALKLETMVITALRHQCYGELAETKPLYGEVIRIARSINHRPALLSGLTWRGFVYFFQSEYQQAEEVLSEARELAIELRDGFRLLNCLFCLGLVIGNQGRMSEAIRTFNQAIEIAKRNGDHAVRAKLPNCLGWIYRELQDFDRAREYDQSGVEIAREDKIREAEAHSLLNVGNDLTLNDTSQKPLAAFREAEAVFGSDDWLRWRFNIRYQAGQAEYWLTHGDLHRARDYARQLLESANRHGVHKYISVAHKLLGEVASARGDLKEAHSHFNIALDELREYPTPLVAWRIYASLGRNYLKTNKLDESRNAFAYASNIVKKVAASVDDDELRYTFINSPAVREVMSGVRSQQDQ